MWNYVVDITMAGGKDKKRFQSTSNMAEKVHVIVNLD